jgi:hypothetical protein
MHVLNVANGGAHCNVAAAADRAHTPDNRRGRPVAAANADCGATSGARRYVSNPPANTTSVVKKTLSIPAVPGMATPFSVMCT